MVSAQNLAVPERQRLHYSGSNRQGIIGPVALPAWEDGWQVDAELKKTIYGSNRVAVGGATEELADPANLSDTRGRGKPFHKPGGSGSNEPFTYQSMGRVFYEELIHSLNLKGIIDLSFGDGLFAKACISLRVPYFGVAMTDAHVKHGVDEVVAWQLELLRTEGQDMYDAQCANDYKAYSEACAKAAKATKRPGAAAAGAKKKPKYTKDQLEAMLAKAKNDEEGEGDDTEDSADA